MSDHRVPARRAPLEDANVRAARQGTVDARGVGPSDRYRLRCVVASPGHPAHVPAVISSPDLGVLAVAAAGVLCVFPWVVDALPAQCLRRRVRTSPLFAAV